MNSIAYIETEDGMIKAPSKEAAIYASKISDNPAAIILGSSMSEDAVKGLGKLGMKNVYWIKDESLNVNNIQAYASAIINCIEKHNAEQIVFANSSLGTIVAARCAAKLDASIATNVVSLPENSNGYKVKRSIYTGKAFAFMDMVKSKKILCIKKNAVEVVEGNGIANITTLDFNIPAEDTNSKVTGAEKASGDILLTEAEIVVSGGRGLKGPEHWGMVEELAGILGAATGCSKPVSDMEWRPHHEHVGQTGIKVSPQLYIAIGISGAIQHLAGVNSSKYILVINKDPEAPFFKAADYGVVGDAFEVVPKLIEELKALN